MHADHSLESAQLRTLAQAQGLTLTTDQLATILPVYLGHRRQAQLLRDGVALTDEPALIFAPAEAARDDDATRQRD
jgi:hypothetical protein